MNCTKMPERNITQSGFCELFESVIGIIAYKSVRTVRCENCKHFNEKEV